uniref:Mediator of RNA polymerase II transcription subunit 13 n=1 Tax=Loa loa TaxID=7209 RepID=A0A1I7VHE0_LOALO
MSTNGGSLEDCHTNVFALTELNGLKWKCLTTPLSQRTWTSLEQDPVLSAYARCLQAGILCAWRRQPPQPTGTLAAMQLPDYRIDVVKELWVFWYSHEEPDCLTEYTSHLACTEDGQGNWSIPGIQYETRTLFFKALHNLIERNMLKNGYIRIGKYFTRPYEVPSSDRIHCSPNYVNGISFNFFVHGENTVCATVSVQRQPTLFRLSRRHLDLGKKQPVILGPWSMRAVLLPEQPRILDSATPILQQQPPTPHCGSFTSSSAPYSSRCREPLSSVVHQVNPVPSSSVDSDTVSSSYDGTGTISKAAVDKLWSEWLQFFCLIVNVERNISSADTVGYIGYTENASPTKSSLPKMVLVDVDGVHMWYPSSLIVVQASDDLLMRQNEKTTNDDDSDFLNSRSNSSSFTARTPPATGGHTRLRSTPSFRKRKKKLSECDGGLSAERHNAMYGTMVNGARSAQRFFEESFIAPANNRRKENTESPSSSGLGLLMSAATSDDDCRWNFTDGMRRKDREEECGCHQCRIQHSSGTATMSNLSSQCIAPQQGMYVCIGQDPSQSCCAPINFSSNGSSLKAKKERPVIFHRRSSFCARSLSPPRSPPWEKKILATSSEVLDGEPNLDWIRESYFPNSRSSSRSGRTDSMHEDRHICPKTPDALGITGNAERRRVQRNSVQMFSKIGSCKPVYQNLSPTSRPRSPACDTSQTESLNRMQSKDCLSNDFASLSARKRGPTIAEQQPNLINSLRLRKDRKSKGRKRKADEKLEWSGIESLDVSFLTAKVGEDNEDGDGINFTCSNDFNLHECKLEINNGAVESSGSSRSAVPQTGSSLNNILTSQAQDGLRNLPVFSQIGSVLPSSASVNLTSSIFTSDCDTQPLFLDDCNPSAIAVIERRSPVDTVVTDSVHLSPPASNERVEPTQILGGTVANVMARVGGPPSVGDYMIYPTPPSVDATQSQQFSPQNTLIQANPTSILYPPTVSYMAAAAAAVNLCHSIPPAQLPPSIISETDITTDIASSVKREFDNDDERLLGKLHYSIDEKPVYGKFMKLEMTLSGKFAGNILAKEFLSLEAKKCRMLEGVYADQLKLIKTAVAAREKRKKVGRAPDYLFMRERLRNLAPHSPFATVRHYRMPYNNGHMLPSHCLPTLQMLPHGMSMNGVSNYVTNGPPFTGTSYNANNSVMSLIMGSGCMPSGGNAIMQPMPVSSRIGVVHMNQQMPMTHLRPLARMPSIPPYASSQMGALQHTPFMGQSAQFCGPPGVMNAPNPICSFPGGPICSMSSGPMQSSHMLGGMHGTTPSQPPQSLGANTIHSTGPPNGQFSIQQPQQPFQQLSHFVNNANFNGQMGMGIVNPSQQNTYQQQMMFRCHMSGNLPAQHPIHSSDSYGIDSQSHASVEPPPSFSQAVNHQYAAVHNVQAGSMMYSQSGHIMRPNTLMAQAQNPNMMCGPRTSQNPMMTVPSSMGSPNNGGIFGSRLMNMPHVMDTTAVPTSNIRTNPEGKSLVLAVLLQDTVLDLHYDSVFDACPICSCNGSIRAKELGVYITPPEVLRQPAAQQQLIVSKPTSGFYNNTSNSCNCGFSAVRHRYLSMKAGLFAEDAKEATDINETQSQPAIPHTIWFDSMSGRDMNFIALLREQTLVRDLGGLLDQVTLLSLQCERASQTERIGSDSSKHCEYIISEVDQRELPLVFQAACEVACMEMNCRRPPHDVRSVLLHDWGVQVSNEMREPRESECMALLQEIGPILEESLRIARSSPLFGSNNIVEGPLTWRFFDRKALKAAGGMEDDSGPEAVPNIVVASEKDAVITSPQIIRLWEKMSLEPYDQPKDVLYIGVVPDNLICIEKTKKYLMDLSRMYEQCRFGRHIPFSREVLRDGLLRVPTRYPATNPGECDNFLNQVERHIGDNKSLITRLKVYMQYFENEMARILINNDDIFSRDKYRAALADNQMHSLPHVSMASYQCGGYTVSSSDHMPPPSAPGSIIISGQSSEASHGPSSTSGPNSSSATSASIGESLTPEGSIGDGSAQNMNSFSSFMTEQLVADGIIAEDEPGTLPHVIVIYLVNPFLLGAEENPLVARVVTVALMRAFNALLYRLNNKRRPQLQLEMIALQSIFDYCGVSADFLKDERGRLNGYDQGRLEKSQNERLSSSDSLKTIAFSVYTHSRVVLPDIVRGILPKSMTRFGPASAMVDLLNELERKEPIYYKVPSKPFILAPPSPVMQRPNCDLMQISTDEAVLFVSYCLIGNDWLAATVTDHQGHSLDNCLINLRLKPDHKRVNMRYKQSTQIRDSLYRLWSYILGTLANGTRNWRLVIGRVGRIGHGEFKFWTQILSKSYLKQVGTRMKHVCRACHVMPGTSEVPGVLSACLVSLEPEAHLRVFPSSFQHDDRFLKNSRHRTLTTPDDTSCTHILVFPTSPELNLDHQGGNGVAELEEDDFSNLLTEEIGEEFSELIGNGEDLMTNGTGPPPQSTSFRLGGNTGIPSEYADLSIENQPLATGYYISTAPASDLPEWFWSACPSAKRRNPVHLKSSLHLNTPNVQQGDDISSFGKGTEACHHQLDSQATADVLRYVLEMYNALSWLNMDLVNGERRSCLPVHIQALMWLCNAVNRFIN